MSRDRQRLADYLAHILEAVVKTFKFRGAAPLFGAASPEPKG